MQKTVKDSFGEIKVPENAFWGGVTQRAIEKFQIGELRMMREIIEAIAIVKLAAAKANSSLGVLESNKAEAIEAIAKRIYQGEFQEQFPLLVWQTGSGTATNMNVNEVIANLANSEFGFVNEQLVHPNDDVNKGQSTNDVFPSAMHISIYKEWQLNLKESLKNLELAIEELVNKAGETIKIGRTHLQDATPLKLKDELESWRIVVNQHIERIENASKYLLELPIGGTAVGSGTNCADGYSKRAVEYINEFFANEGYGFKFKEMDNKFRNIAFRDSIASFHGEIKSLATSLIKIGNDIRFYSSGPRAGFGEFEIPANEPGSSIMPGKVNPTQIEVLSQVCAQIIGNDATISFANSQGNFQLNVYMPVIAYNALNSIDLLSLIINSFVNNLLKGLEFKNRKIDANLKSSLMLVTALNPVIGYESAAKVAKYAYKNDLTLIEALRELRSELQLNISDSDILEMLKPENMV